MSEPFAEISAELMSRIRRWANELGFQALEVSDTDLSEDEARFFAWLDEGRAGDMDYLSRHGHRRTRPHDLVPGTVRIITVRMNYLPRTAASMPAILEDPERAYISRYALGRDYHKLIRTRLQRLASRIETVVGPFGYRAFADSAPVLERALAAKSGLGWTGKHTNIIARGVGSWFFLGELYTNLPLPISPPVTAHCGTCRACLDVCPTDAFTGPHSLDARRCISYLTIEHQGSIPTELRPRIGNRVFGCDDCQMVCPFNRDASFTEEPGFEPRHGLDDSKLTELFSWGRTEFDQRTRGSPLRRIGYERWLRNIAVGLGNAPSTPAVKAALERRRDHASALVREHVSWALTQHAKGEHPR